MGWQKDLLDALSLIRNYLYSLIKHTSNPSVGWDMRGSPREARRRWVGEDSGGLLAVALSNNTQKENLRLLTKIMHNGLNAKYIETA